MNQQIQSKSQEISLESGVANLGYGPVTVTMLAGCGWITSSDDFVLETGERATFDASQHPIVISSAYDSDAPIVFQVDYQRSVLQSNERTAQYQPKFGRILNAISVLIAK